MLTNPLEDKGLNVMQKVGSAVRRRHVQVQVAVAQVAVPHNSDALRFRHVSEALAHDVYKLIPGAVAYAAGV